MANFSVHLRVAASCSSIVAVLGIGLHLIDVQHTPWLIFIGIVGGMLPDIDAAHSRPVRLLFSVLALLSVTMTLSILKNYYKSPCVLLAGPVIYGLIRYLILVSIKRFTVHRGLFHSLLALCFFSFSMTCVSYYSLNQNAIYAWLNGFFLGVGFLVHLLLDEMYSVDLVNRRIKKSFGSALKLFNYKNMLSSVLMACLTFVLYCFSPPLLPLLTLSERVFAFRLF